MSSGTRTVLILPNLPPPCRLNKGLSLEFPADYQETPEKGQRAQRPKCYDVEQLQQSC